MYYLCFCLIVVGTLIPTHPLLAMAGILVGMAFYFFKDVQQAGPIVIGGEVDVGERCLM